MEERGVEGSSGRISHKESFLSLLSQTHDYIVVKNHRNLR